MPSMTITTTAQQAQRLATAFGRELGLRDEQGQRRDATAAEIKQATIGYLRSVVVQQERRAAEDEISIPEFDPT